MLIEHAPSNNSAKPQPAANNDAVSFILQNSNRFIIEERQCSPAIAYSCLSRSDRRTYPFASTFRGRQGEVTYLHQLYNTSLNRPANPVEFVANYLLQHNPDKK